jgi:hypothetical protein
MLQHHLVAAPHTVTRCSGGETLFRTVAANASKPDLSCRKATRSQIAKFVKKQGVVGDEVPILLMVKQEDIGGRALRNPAYVTSEALRH